MHEALTQPGKIHAAYSAFWNYSFGNQLMAIWQLGKAEPIGTYKHWQAVGRQVTKGQKAITLLMPVDKKKVDDETGEEGRKRIFIERKNWFGLSQTSGEPYVPEPLPDVDLDLAIEKLGIKVRPFEMVNGNVQGYAIPNQRIIAVSPIAFDKPKTKVHETGHVLLHGTEGQMIDGEQPERSAKEVEAELTAYLVKAALGITKGQVFSRGYLQDWLKGTEPEKVRYSAVFGAVDKILRAGRPSEIKSADAPQTSHHPHL